MPPMHLETTFHDGKARIALNGRFDFDSHRIFRDSYEALLKDQNTREIEIDLDRVDYLDSSALGMLLLLREKAAMANKSLALANSHGMVQQVLDVANFNKLFTLR